MLSREAGVGMCWCAGSVFRDWVKALFTSTKSVLLKGLRCFLSACRDMR